MRLFPKDRDLAETLERVELRVDASDLRQRVDDVHVRLDQFLAARLRWRSRSSVQRLIRDGYVLVDPSTPEQPLGSGVEEVERRPGRRLRHKSRVVVVVPEGLRVRVTAEAHSDLAVLWEDAWLLAVDKPPGLAVHPSGRHLSDTLIQRVHARYRAERVRREARPRLCHRLDRETSGIVLVGLDPDTHSRAMRAFEERRVEKEYLAIVHGVPESARGTIDAPLGPARRSSVGLRMAVTPAGLEARTDWTRVSAHGDFALLRCRLHTGRQHQIRVHLESIGHPIVGDKIYGHDGGAFQRNLDGELTDDDHRALLLPRHALHHCRLAFDHPRTGERVDVESPLAEDLEDFLERAT